MSKTKRSLAQNYNGNGAAYKNRFVDLDILNINESSKDKDLDLKLIKSASAKTPNQKKYMKSMNDNDITFCTGPAGTGKTHLGIGYAAQCLSHGNIERIILVRPAVPTEEELGHLPGDLQAKLNPYLRPAFDELLDFFTVKQINKFTDGKFPIIEGVALGQIKGRTFKKSIVILDEAQDATYRQLKNLLTRIGQGTKIVVTGDSKQSDKFINYRECALEQVISRMNGATGVGMVRFDRSDIQRHPRIEEILSRLEDD